MKTIVFVLLLFVSSTIFFFFLNSYENLSEKDYFIKAHAMAANEFNDSLLLEYVKLYPDGVYIEKANLNIDICAWQNARNKNTQESYQSYINNFPKGKAVALAEKMLQSLQTPQK